MHKKNIEQLQNSTVGVTIHSQSTITEPPPLNRQQKLKTVVSDRSEIDKTKI